MEKNSKIYIAGHNGMVGGAILRYLKNEGYYNIILKNRKQLDLTNQKETLDFFKYYKPDYVFLAAAKVGGIFANSTYPAEFIYDNIVIESNVIKSSYETNVKKMLYLGSSCIYPKYCQQPIKEEYLLTGELEETNEPYAIAKIAGIKMCQAFNKQYNTNYISVMPTNLYGINDNYHINNSHVFPAMIKKFHDAIANNTNVYLWGTGEPYREFLNVDDCASACVFLMNNYNDSDIINIGTGSDIKIKDLAIMFKNVLNFKGDIIFDDSKPDGTPRKLLDVSKLTNLGWKYSIELEDGIISTYNDYIHL